jgi:hypothetical protein
MKKILAGIILLGLLIASPAPAGKGVTPMLKMQTTYNFVFFRFDFLPASPFVERTEDIVWALVWEGTIHGDIEGVIRWWVEFDQDSGEFGGLGRWEIWDCESVYPSSGCDFYNPDLLIMAGHDAFAYVSGNEWAGKGIVAYARDDYAEWMGHRITDGGYVDYDEITSFPVYGEGPFVIYDRPSHKH